jgi:hypothetical protein
MKEDRGAVAVLVALLMVPLIGFAALVVDIGALYAERRELQNGADAAALAISQRCATGSCGDTTTLAQQLADANARDQAAGIGSVSLGTGRVTVVTRSREPDGSDTAPLTLAPVLGIDRAQVTARSAAAWGSPSGGPAVIPLAFSWCAFAAQTGGGIPSTTTEQVIRYQDLSGTTCTGPSGKTIPGGFGWLKPDADRCGANARIADAQTPGKPGVSVPGTCTGADFAALQGQTVLLPVFQEAGGTGGSGWYQIYGFAAFTLTGYRFSGDEAFNWNNRPECRGDDRCVKGYFVQFVSLDAAFELGGPDLGGRSARLVE